MPLGIGFMGNLTLAERIFALMQAVTNASRHWVHGELSTSRIQQQTRISSHKCLSALGSWGTAKGRTAVLGKDRSHKCLSALGSWGEYAMVNYEC